jgi:hypothetical protein
MYYSPKILALLLLGTLTRNANGCDDRPVIVSQQGETGEHSFNTVDTHETVQDFYHYTNYGFDFEHIVPTEKGRSMMFIHRDLDTCELSLVTVHDHKPNDTILGKVRLWFSGDIEDEIVVKDDADDSYVVETLASGVRTSVFWKFTLPARKDGFAFNLGDDTFDCFTVNPRLFQGITSFKWAYPITNGGTDIAFHALNMGTGNVITVCAPPEQASPVKLNLLCEVMI